MSSSFLSAEIGVCWASFTGGMTLSERENGGTLVYDSGKDLIDLDFGWSLFSGTL